MCVYWCVFVCALVRIGEYLCIFVRWCVNVRLGAYLCAWVCVFVVVWICAYLYVCVCIWNNGTYISYDAMDKGVYLHIYTTCMDILVRTYIIKFRQKDKNKMLIFQVRKHFISKIYRTIYFLMKNSQPYFKNKYCKQLTVKPVISSQSMLLQILFYTWWI